MSKPNSIRKKALEYAKKRQWDLALKEYIKLAEIEQHNPNVYNELGDLHLKLGDQRQAFEAFHSAIDAYSRVSLFNNAVAVCKKIIRLNSDDHTVYGKLAKLRNQQGFKKEAESYGMMFLDKLVQDSSIDAENLKEKLIDLAAEMDHAPVVLERVAEYLIKWEFKEEAGGIYSKLINVYASKGMTQQSQQVKEKMAAVGFAPGEDPSSASDQPDDSPSLFDLDSDDSFDSSQIEVDGLAPADSPPGPQAADEEADFVRSFGKGADYGSVELEGAEQQPAPAGPRHTAVDELETEPGPEPPGASKRAGAAAPPPAPEAPEAPDPGPSRPLEEDEVWIPSEELPDNLKKGQNDEGGQIVNVSQIVGEFHAEVKANIDADDYRSHYDLAMAYLEMDLLPEAIREFQFASNSSLYQIRSLEMIGLCFIKQNQPRLAIKQLEKGLRFVGEGDPESLGLQYNLGLAYEMIGDIEKAKLCFEDVYVVDVTFRDVGEKMKRYSS